MSSRQLTEALVLQLGIQSPMEFVPDPRNQINDRARIHLRIPFRSGELIEVDHFADSGRLCGTFHFEAKF